MIASAADGHPEPPPRQTVRRALAPLAVAIALLAPATPAAATPLPRIVNGLDTQSYPAVGAMLCAGSAINDNNAQLCCSGTLIGCQTFLTAAHCVDGDLNASHYWVYLQHGGLFSVSAVAEHPNANFPIADVAVLKLAAPVTGIAPMPINTVNNPASVGFNLAGTIVGFGQTTGSANNYGIKRYGKIATLSCNPAQAGGNDTQLVCWDYLNPVGPPGQDSNTCNGDSGGPLFLDLGSGDTVAGTTSGGTANNCLQGDNAFDANVYTYRSFVQTQLGADSTASCGASGQVGDAGVQVIADGGTLSSGHVDDSFTINVPANTAEVRFAMNGEDNGVFDVDLYVKNGPGAGQSNYDCKANGADVYGVCDFSAPGAGPWSVLVHRYSGSGQYQLTTTLFASNAVCGNNVAEPGEQCDGSDPGTCPTGTCEPDCTCPPPVCGNNIIEAGEQCDGTDPGACPTGACDPDCTCPDPVCGNGIIEAGEACDDGNLASGDCCSPTCQMPSGCSPAGKSVLVVNDVTGTKSDRITWKWLKGVADAGDFGDPVAGSDYSLCIWDDGQLVHRQDVPAGGLCGRHPCWKAIGPAGNLSGFKFSDPDGNADGVFRVLLKQGAGTARALWKAKGNNVSLPGPASASRYFAQSSEVTVQVVRHDASACWQADFPDAKRNDAQHFRAVEP